VLADALETTETHISVLDWRARQRTRRRRVAARPRAIDSDGIVSSAPRVEWLDHALSAIRRQHERAGEFPGGLDALDRFRPQLGRPRSLSMLRLLGRWHEHRAWFAVHSGFTHTAIASARTARTIYGHAYRDSRSVADLQRLADTALIAAHAHLYINEPGQCLAWLTEVRQACVAGSRPLGSDYYRQLGTAYALEAHGACDGGLDTASRVLAQVPLVMARLGEGRSEPQLAFATRQRHLHGTPVNVEACDALIEIADHFYGPESLESLIAANYSAAAHLATDSRSSHRNAYERLQLTLARGDRFPHQRAVTYLLRLTSRLRLQPDLRRVWVRQVSYLNPYRKY
jgi:hypothetical protein